MWWNFSGCLVECCFQDLFKPARITVSSFRLDFSPSFSLKYKWYNHKIKLTRLQLGCFRRNGNRWKKLTWWAEFKFWTRLFRVHFTIMPQGIASFSSLLWVNETEFLLGKSTSIGEGKASCTSLTLCHSLRLSGKIHRLTLNNNLPISNS